MAWIGPMRRRAAVLVLLGTAVAWRAPRADESDAAIAANPALGRVARQDPARARALLAEIDAAQKAPPGEQKPLTRGLSPLAGEDRALLDENPALGRLYIHDASAALSLLRRVKEAGGGAK